MKKNAVTRIWCSCGWEEWFPFDPELSNEEVTKLVKPIIKKHRKTHK